MSVVALFAACATEPVAPPVRAVGSAALGTSRSPLVEPPGVLFADQTLANIGTTICVSGWIATVRPPPAYTQRLKRQMLARAGLKPAEAPQYELDHFVPLALGGHPTAEANLWLQSWVGEWSARIKDRLERKLQAMVCTGRLGLDVARSAVQRDWRAAYREFVGPDAARERGAVAEEEVVE